MECKNVNLKVLKKEDCKPKTYVSVKIFFKLLKKAIKNSKNIQDLSKVYEKAVENRMHLTKAQGDLIDEMYLEKAKEL